MDGVGIVGIKRDRGRKRHGRNDKKVIVWCICKDKLR